MLSWHRQKKLEIQKRHNRRMKSSYVELKVDDDDTEKCFHWNRCNGFSMNNKRNILSILAWIWIYTQPHLLDLESMWKMVLNFAILIPSSKCLLMCCRLLLIDRIASEVVASQTSEAIECIAAYEWYLEIYSREITLIIMRSINTGDC